jgi:hypothetical protein
MAEIIRGTTPPITVRFNFEASIITTLYLTITQSGAAVIEKDLTDGEVDGTDIVFTLTQTETLLLTAGVAALLQVRFLASDGAFASKILDLSVSDILKEGEIT